MNPCKCGYWGDPDKECTCSELERNRYIRKISGPIVDRIDLVVDIRKVDYKNLSSKRLAENSKTIKKRVELAKQRQRKRYIGTKACSNSDMDQKLIRDFVALDTDSAKLLQEAVNKYHMSARGYYRILKVARTIADLEGMDRVKSNHIAEALGYRFGRALE